MDLSFRSGGGGEGGGVTGDGASLRLGFNIWRSETTEYFHRDLKFPCSWRQQVFIMRPRDNSSHVCSDFNRYLKPKHDTDVFVLKPNQTISTEFSLHN